MTYERFDTFYESLAQSLNWKQTLKPIYDDYQYWRLDPTVNGERDKLTVLNNPRQVIRKGNEVADENTERWIKALEAFKVAVGMKFSIALDLVQSKQHLTHHFQEPKVFRAANMLRDSYIDGGAEQEYVQKFGKTKQYTDIKEALQSKVWGLERQVDQWTEALEKLHALLNK